MRWHSDFIAWWDRRIRRFSIVDIKLVQGAAMGVALVIVKLFPKIMTVSIWWFVAWAAVFALRPMWLVFGPQARQ